jgi:adenylate kinase family enzyme
MSQIQHKPLINKLPLSYEQTCDLETALVIAKAYLKATHDEQPSIIAEKIIKYEQLYNHISDFNKSQTWTKIVFPPEIERILSDVNKQLEMANNGSIKTTNG